MCKRHIEASRLQFSGRPAFDPVPLLDPDAASWYAEPLSMALEPEEIMEPVPHVQVRGSRAEVLQLLHSWRCLLLRRYACPCELACFAS